MNLSFPPAYRLEEVGPTHSIVLGFPASGRICEEYRQQAVQMCAAVFASFTVSTEEAISGGLREDSPVFQVATRWCYKVLRLCLETLPDPRCRVIWLE